MWCELLKAVPRARLVLKNKPFLCPETQALWLKRFTSRGVAGWRVDLLPLTAATGDHMSQYAMMDIALDPWPYAGAPSPPPPTPCIFGLCSFVDFGRNRLADVSFCQIGQDHCFCVSGPETTIELQKLNSRPRNLDPFRCYLGLTPPSPIRLRPNTFWSSGRGVASVDSDAECCLAVYGDCGDMVARVERQHY